MKNRKNIILILITIIIINLLTNYNCIISLFNQTKPIIYNLNNITIKNNEYIIENINQKVNMIEINFVEIPRNIEISYTNDSFKNYNHYNQNYYNNKITNYKLYVLTASNNKINNLKLKVNNGQISNIIINPKVKYKLNIIKTYLIFMSLIFINYIIKKNDKLNIKNPLHPYIIILILSILVSICINYYLTYTRNNYTFGDLYEYYYTNAILNKKLNLDYQVDEKLLQSTNPYDTSNRNFNYLWDASYYKGKYYCYFGIWPIISLFIPFINITKTYLTTPFACLIYSILSIIGTYIIYDNIIKKYFKNINFQIYIISFLFIILGSKILWCMHRPNFYELVSLAAYTHIIFGLYLGLFQDKKLSNFIGYTLLATAVLCRPTSLLSSILIIPKIINKIKKKEFKLIDFIILIIPYTVIGLFTMYINYIRFDSIFEFGISYQLTTNNLYNYKFSIFNSICGLYNYLFGMININLIPFDITGINNRIPLITDFHIENIGGGVITTSILGIIIFFIPKIFKYIKQKELKTYIILSLTIALSLIIFSSGIGALIGRYMLDFNYIFYFIIVILCITTINHFKNQNIITIYKILTIISIFINLILSTTNN